MKKRENESYLSEVLSKLTEHKMAMVGLFVITLEIILVVVLPFIMHLNPYDSDYTAFSAAPSGIHILGTDAIGRDIFARLVYGGRTSLLVGLLSTIISCAIGVPLGLIAGYFRGKAEIAIMRVADIFMSFPSIVLILVLVAVIGPSIWSVTIVIGVLGWTQFARLIYANVLSVSEKEYVESARAIGTSNYKIITKYILPNSFAPILEWAYSRREPAGAICFMTPSRLRFFPNGSGSGCRRELRCLLRCSASISWETESGMLWIRRSKFNTGSYIYT